MSAFLVDAKPKNRLKGSEVLFYVREDGQTRVIEQEAPTRIISDRKPMPELEEIVKKELPGVIFDEPIFLYHSKKDDEDIGIVHARAPKEIRRDVAALLHNWEDDTRISPTASLRMEYPPMQNVVLENGQIVDFTGNYVSMDSLLQEKAYAMDIEFIDNNIFMAIMTTLDPNFGNFLFTSIPIGTDYLELQPWMLEEMHGVLNSEYKPKQLGTHIVYCPDQETLIRMLSEKEQLFDGLFVFGHNIFGDYFKLREGGEYIPGIDNNQPRISTARKSKKGDYYKIVMPIPGRYPIDTYHSVRDQNHGYNHSLAALAASLGFPFFKGSNFAELKVDYYLAQRGNEEAALRLANYTIFDGIISKLVGQRVLPNILRRAYTLRTAPGRTNSTNVITLGRENEKRRHLKQTNEQDGVFNKKHYWYDSPLMEEDLESMLPEEFKENGELKAKGGYYQEVQAVYPTVVMNAFQMILLKDPHLARAYQHVTRKLEEPCERIHLARTIQAALEVPYAMVKDFFGEDFLNPGMVDNENYSEVYNSRRKGIQDWNFGKRYHEDGLGFEKVNGGNSNYWHLHRNLVLLRQMFQNALRNTKYITKANPKNDDMLFLEGIVDESLEGRGVGINIGSGPAIALNNGGIIARIDSKTMYKNIGITRKRASDFEKETILGFIDLALSDYGNYDAMYDYLLEQFLELQKGNIPKTRLLIKEKGEFFGFGNKQKTPEDEFLHGMVKPEKYRANFHQKYGEIVRTVLPENKYKQYVELIESGPQLRLF